MTRPRYFPDARGIVPRIVCCLCSISMLWAQNANQLTSIEPVRPKAPIIARPYLPTTVPPIRLTDSSRLQGLIRAGILYLTVQDAIALALENNIDIEIARYGPILAAWNLNRAEAGGALPGVPSGASQAASVASGQGVAGSQAAAGVSNTGQVTARNATNATISQVGPVTQNLDPAFQQASTFSHTSSPQPNSTQSITPVLISNGRVYTGSYQQGFLTGGGITVSFSDHFLHENALTDVLNPSSATSIALTFQHSLLQGFGTAVNGRTITVNRINLDTSALTFRTQVIGVVVNVLNLYYGLVADYEDVRAKRSAMETAQQFFNNSKKSEEVGTLSALDVTTAESQLAATQRDLVISETTLRQEEVQLKNQLSRRGVMDPVLANVQVMPLDRIVVPATDNLPPLSEMVQEALANRSDLAAERANEKAAEVSSLGTRNGILPRLQAIGGTTQAGLAGTAVQTPFGTADPAVVGNIGTALAQSFSRDYPTNRIAALFQATINNRQAQADFGIDQLQLRQTQLTQQKDFNQVQVSVSNYVTALRQARSRYQAAARNTILERQLYDAEQRKFELGASTPYNVTQQQRDLVAAQATEVAALAAYSSARIALDQTLGTTLEANNVSIDEARSGVVSRSSSLPDVLPSPEADR